MRDLRQTFARRAALGLAAVAPGFGEGRLGRPCLVVTAGRSGSTFLMRVLDQLPGLAVYPGEANRLWHPNAYPRRRFGDEVPLFWRQPEGFTEYSLSHRSEADARRLRAVFGAYRALMGGGPFICKSAMIQFMLPWVDARFAEARYVHLIRDGRAVALSYGKRLLARDAPAGAAPRPDAEMLRGMARLWRDSIDAVRRADALLGLTAAGRLLEVTYESLCADPAAGLSRLASFLGLPPPGSDARVPTGFDSRNWKAERELPPALAAELAEIMRPGLDRYGYA